MFGELQGRTTVTYRKVGSLEWTLRALFKFCLKVTFIHVLDEEVWTWPELNAMAAVTVPPKGFAFRSVFTGEREGCHDQQAKDRHEDNRS